MMEQVTDAWSAGISDYLIKPCKRADLARTLSYWEHVVHTGAEHRPMSDKMRAVG
jgi:response regulator of citrate/malate metabolism